MGRKTYDSIGRPLPGRTTFVITRDRMWRGDGVRAVPSVDEALDQALLLDSQTIFVAGGGEIYRAAWDRLTGLEITEVDQNPDGEVTFPRSIRTSGSKPPVNRTTDTASSAIADRTGVHSMSVAPGAVVGPPNSRL